MSGKEKRAQKVRKDISNQTPIKDRIKTEEAPRLALQSSENKKSEITRERKNKKEEHAGKGRLLSSRRDRFVQINL